ncbi:hypothetical protein ACFLQ3_03005 [Bacteroidota bacterium]
MFENPIASKISHPELEITKIEITDSITIISLKVTNKRSQGGWFCADKNIIVKNTNGFETYELIKSENIPTCPDQFEFAYSGQVLEFILYFPVIPKDIKFIDLIENCSNACFFFNGIILDNDHNKKIRAFETGFDLYQNSEYEKSIPYFEKVLSGEIYIKSHIYGLSYYYLILVNKNLGNKNEQEKWYNQLLNSTISDKQTFINELKKEIDI